MSDTPISDSTPHNVADLGMLCRTLERQLNSAQQRIKRLEEAGDALKASGYFGGWADAVNKWIKAKEDKL